MLKVGAEHDAAVIEMGMRAKGEISYLSRMVKPDMAIITNIGTSHIETLGSKDEILKAKLEITDGMKSGGVLMLCADDARLKAAKPRGVIPVLVGVENEKADYRATNLRADGFGMRFDFRTPDRVMRDMFIPAPSTPGVYAAAFAATCGIFSGMSEEEIKTGLLRFSQTGMRQKIRVAHGVTIIEDCYNASPESVRASIDTLKYVNNSPRRTAVLGKMHELGKYSIALHADIGDYAAKNLDVLYVFGDSDDVLSMAREYKKSGREPIYLGSDVIAAEKILKNNIAPGDVLLFKASRAEKLERLSEKL
ncbi:MAG: UDP-N-acetylmuramoyl-tripeptide--D-alanyl-D-alanine ligase [Clostridiales bacterium]|nr:UDP-N-acetylmuramoyl-tripeptide--D-alanyl-D-alanine ligase [Clostridiales bacterium]